MKIRSKTGLRVFGMAEIRSWGPCYDPVRHLPETFRGTAVDLLTNDKIPLQDRLWAVLRTALISEKTLRLFAVWAARQVQHLSTDPRVEKCLQTVEAYIEGRATLEEMREARRGVVGARYAAYTYAAYADAAYAYAYAAYAAADAAADADAYAVDAAADAAYAAAYAAYADAAYADAAYADARTAAREKQVAKLIEMVKADGLTRLTERKAKKKAHRSKKVA